MARPVAENMYNAVMLDMWPSGMAAMVDFGLTSQEHYEGLYDPIRAGAISLEKLDEILGDGPAITQAVRAYKKNRFPNIVYKTSYDVFEKPTKEGKDA